MKQVENPKRKCFPTGSLQEQRYLHIPKGEEIDTIPGGGDPAGNLGQNDTAEPTPTRNGEKLRAIQKISIHARKCQGRCRPTDGSVMDQQTKEGPGG